MSRYNWVPVELDLTDHELSFLEKDSINRGISLEELIEELLRKEIYK